MFDAYVEIPYSGHMPTHGLVQSLLPPNFQITPAEMCG